MSGIDFARSDLSPGLLRELVLKDSLLFKYLLLKYSQKPGGYSYIIEDMDVRQGFSNPYPLQTKISAKF